MTTAKAAFKMLPYRRQGEIDYASLEFNPDEKELPPDHMEQNQEIREIIGLIAARHTEFDTRPDVFLDNETYICYDPRNLNLRISPDIYLAFGVDAQAIRPRKLYLPWEVGKPPDLAIEVASESTGTEDVNRKPAIYAAIGIAEYWRFDPTGGRYHDAALSGYRLVNGIYQAIELTTEPDGILKGYSPILEMSLCWDEGWPRLYDLTTGTYQRNWQQEWYARVASEERAEAAEERAETAEERAEAAEAEVERLRTALRRLREDG
jgi:Uma2 family endonuclease